jgi:hypothetical protein
MQSRASWSAAWVNAGGSASLRRSRMLVLALAGLGALTSSSGAQPRDDHHGDSRGAPARAQQAPPRESSNRGSGARESRPPAGRPSPAPNFRPQMESAPRPNFAPQQQPGRQREQQPDQQARRPEYMPHNPAYGPQGPARPDPQARYGSPNYGSPGNNPQNYGSPGYRSPNYASPNYGSPNYPSPQNVPEYRTPYDDQRRNPAYNQPTVPPNVGSRPGQQHLGDWLDRHQALSPQEKERALQSEPGFNRLAPDQQQRLVQKLRDLNNMRPGERDRTLARAENLERLSPQQRDQVRGAAGQLRYMPMDRQRAVRRAFQDLRNVPPGLRNSELNSPRFAGQFSPEERSVLGNLLTVEPYQPAPPPQYP